jgi:hypothetical protein
MSNVHNTAASLKKTHGTPPRVLLLIKVKRREKENEGSFNSLLNANING